MLRGRPDQLVALYAALEQRVRSLGEVEIVARDRYVLFRSKRIFTDVVIMSDGVRVAVHLGREVGHALFFKVVSDARHVTHVAKLKAKSELAALAPFLEEAYAFSLRDVAARGLTAVAPGAAARPRKTERAASAVSQTRKAAQSHPKR